MMKNWFIGYRPTNIADRDEGISDVEDATELKLLLELSEQVIYTLLYTSYYLLLYKYKKF